MLRPIVLLSIFIFAVTCVTFSDVDQKEFDIVAKRYAFEPAEITVHKGVPVTLKIRSTDVAHGLAVKRLNIATEVRKGGTATLTFVARDTGTFEGQCNKFCGAGHGKMHFTIHVVD